MPHRRGGRVPFHRAQAQRSLLQHDGLRAWLAPASKYPDVPPGRRGPGAVLGRKTRSCATVALLVALGKEQELAAHLRGALNNGVSRDELKEVLLQTAIYCGIPAANAAFRVAAEVLM